MVDLRDFHSMLIEMHSGMLTLATFCVFAIILHRLQRRTPENERQQGRMPALSMLSALLEKTATYSEPTSYLASVGGFIGLVVSSIVGYFAWPAEILLTYSLTQNKIMMAILSMEFWAIFLLVRTKYGKNVWMNPRLSIVCTIAGFSGFFFMVLTGSMGGHMTAIHVPGRGSVLDPVYYLLGINPEALWIGTIPFLGLVFLIPVVFLALLRFHGKKDQKNL